MPVIHTRCCGLDVHKASVTACVLVFNGKKNEERVRQFGTTTGELIRLRCWLKSSKVTHAAMESTGVYWKPVWHELKSHFDLTLVNPQFGQAEERAQDRPQRQPVDRRTNCRWTSFPAATSLIRIRNSCGI